MLNMSNFVIVLVVLCVLTRRPTAVIVYYRDYGSTHAKVSRNESSREQKFPRTFVPGSEKAREQKGQGANGKR